MATASNTPRLDLASYPPLAADPVPYVVLALLFCVLIYSLQGSKPSPFPILNPRGRFDFTNFRAKQQFFHGAFAMVRKRFAEAPNTPFRAIADIGEITVLTPQYLDDVRSEPRFNFSELIFNSFHANLPGFESFREGLGDSDLVKKVAQKQLTQSLGKLTKPLSEECDAAIRDILTDSPDWHEVVLRDFINPLVARMSSKVFLGDDLCRDPEWLDITINHAKTVFIAASILRFWPQPFRPIVHWFLGSCRAARKQVKDARRLIARVVEKRRATKAALRAQGKEVVYDDAIEWCDQTAKGEPYDAAVAQLVLSLAAIATTSDLLTQTMLDIASHPEILEPLREEIVAAISEGGLEKQSLYKMKLLDSCIKESQRIKPLEIAGLKRLATSDVTLSDGTVIQKGTKIAISMQRMWDQDVYKDAEVWDGYRFLRLREIPGRENMAQLVSTHADHLGFGYGQHACPGRFFAANEIKIALCHLILKYDWKLVEGTSTTPFKAGMAMRASLTAQLLMRRREDEVSL